jgi:predicted peroxiredoxin
MRETMKQVMLGLALVCLLAGCNTKSGEATVSGDLTSLQKVALISITSDADVDPQAVNMGLTFANFCLEEGFKVAIFFNVKGVKIPTVDFPDDQAYGEHAPFKQQIATLSQQGVEIHVCPVCMGDLGVVDEDIMEGAFKTTKPKLFANLGVSTVVFTY